MQKKRQFRIRHICPENFARMAAKAALEGKTALLFKGKAESAVLETKGKDIPIKNCPICKANLREERAEIISRYAAATTA